MVSDQRVLLVAAEAREFAGLLPFCSGVRRLSWPVHWATYGESAGRQWWMVANGAGAGRAGKAVALAAECAPAVIVSMGFCGALDPALGIGDIFVATAIEAAGQRFDVCLPACDAPHATGVLASIGRVAQTAAEKKLLRESGAGAVEMEAGAVAQFAAARGIRMFCVRSVTDTAGQSFVTDFNSVLLSGGHFGTIRILASALHNPVMAFPELIRLRRSCGIAARALGEFIVNCRF